MYPELYNLKSVDDQIKIIELFLGKLNINYSLLKEIVERPLPKGAEGLFVIPNTKEDNYLASLKFLTEKLEGKCCLCSFVGKYHSKKLSRHPLTSEYFESISSEQKDLGDIFIIPAQFGLRHQGKSVEEVLEGLSSYEVPLGAYEGLYMFFTHSARMYKDDHLYIDCPGDILKNSRKEFSFNLDYQYLRPTLGTRDLKESEPNFGSITAFY